MNKKKICLLCLVLSVAMLLSACGVYTDRVSRPAGGDASQVVTTPGGEEDKNPFTVMLTYNGQVYKPVEEYPITIQWNDGYSVHTAKLDADGIARVGGLDGDYKVTMDVLPEGFIYNPNAYIATNDNRNIVIELQKIVPYQGKGADPYNDPIRINNTGVYCVEVTGPDIPTYFQFDPVASGTYSVQSWMDTTTNEINPYADYWGANAMFAYFQGTYDDGGPEGSYTKNFIMDVEVADEYIAPDGNDSCAFTFGIKATQKNGKYPIKVYIAITLDGAFSLNHTDAEIVAPQATLTQATRPSGTFHWAEEAAGSSGGLALFDAKKFKLNESDGFYHVYDEVKYAANGGWGPVLYAKISQPTRFLEGQGGPTPFTLIEYSGNKALTVEQGTKNYKLFIEGWEYLNFTDMTVPGEAQKKAPYFCDLLCPCRQDKTCDSMELVGINGTCTPDCEKCLITCNKCPAEGIGHKGYAGYCNEDGCYPVTAELRQFLQEFCISQLLFMDGQGFAETHPQYPVFAAEDAQWLFACGYYE